MIICEEVDKLVIAAKIIENCKVCACSAVDIVKYCVENTNKDKIYFFTSDGWKNFYDVFSEFKKPEDLFSELGLENVEFNELSMPTTVNKDENTYVIFNNSEHTAIVCVNKNKFMNLFGV